MMWQGKDRSMKRVSDALLNFKTSASNVEHLFGHKPYYRRSDNFHRTAPCESSRERNEDCWNAVL